MCLSLRWRKQRFPVILFPGCTPISFQEANPTPSSSPLRGLRSTRELEAFRGEAWSSFGSAGEPFSFFRLLFLLLNPVLLFLLSFVSLFPPDLKFVHLERPFMELTKRIRSLLLMLNFPSVGKRCWIPMEELYVNPDGGGLRSGLGLPFYILHICVSGDRIFYFHESILMEGDTEND